MITLDTQIDGVQRRVQLPSAEYAAEEGIPVDVYDKIELMYNECSPSFRAGLWAELWQRGLVEPEDYTKPGALQSFQQALLATIRHDAYSVRHAILNAPEVDEKPRRKRGSKDGERKQ